MLFIDTSALYALADRADEYHPVAKKFFNLQLERGRGFVLHNYILVESAAIMQNRLGMSPAKKFLAQAGWFHVVWVDEYIHNKALRLFTEQKKGARISFVDCVSFVMMKNNRIKDAFAFDADFKKFGFRIYP